MLHLENFFEKSFALLLTTPRIAEKKKITRLFFLAVVSCIMKCKQNTVLVNKHSG